MKSLHLLTFAFLSTTFACAPAGEKDSDNNSTDTDTTDTTDSADSTDPQDYPDPSYGLSTESVTVDEVNREYNIYVPESYSATEPVPVMLNFHGFGGNGEGQMWQSDMRNLADSENFILIYPTGSINDEGSTHWNPALPSEDNKSNADDFGFVSAMLDQVANNYNIDSNRVYATGYSNGAGLAYGLACYLNDRIAAIAPVSGSMYTEMPSTCGINHPTAIAIFNGTADYERPWDGYPGYLLPVDDATAWWVSQNGTSSSPVEDSFSTEGMTVERQIFSGGDGDVSVARYKFIGGGHVWFDMNIEGHDLNTTIWNFVSQYDKNGRR